MLFPYGEFGFTIVSPDGSRVAFMPNPSRKGGRARVYSLTLPTRKLSGSKTDDLAQLQFVGNNRLVGRTRDGRVVLHAIDESSTKPYQILPVASGTSTKSRVARSVLALGLGRNPNEFATIDDQGVITYRDREGTVRRRIQIETDERVIGAAFDATGTHVILLLPHLGIADHNLTHVSISDTDWKQEIITKGSFKPPVRISPDGKLILYCDLQESLVMVNRDQVDRAIYVAGMNNWSKPRWIGFSKCQTLFASSTQGSDIQVIEMELLGTKTELDQERISGTANESHCLAFSPDSRCLAEGTASTSAAEVVLWDPLTRVKKLTLPTAPGRITAVAFSEDGSILAAAHSSGEIYLWFAATADDVSAYEAVEHPYKWLKPDEMRRFWSDLPVPTAATGQ
ncbi:MAG: hypothetical protein R3C28_18960 [Pirellulaceae bacterium]